MNEYERAAVTLARQVDLALGKLSSRADDVIHNDLDKLLGVESIDSRVDDLISIGFRAGMLHARREMVRVLQNEAAAYEETMRTLPLGRETDDD